MAAGPLIRWRRDRASAVARRVAVPGIVMVALFVAVLVAVPGIGVLPLLGLGFAGGLAVASVAPLWGRTLGRTPLFTWGMVIAHLGRSDERRGGKECVSTCRSRGA